jgi:hypothetical protein
LTTIENCVQNTKQFQLGKLSQKTKQPRYTSNGGKPEVRVDILFVLGLPNGNFSTDSECCHRKHKGIDTNNQTDRKSKCEQCHIGISYIAGARRVAKAVSIALYIAYRHIDRNKRQTYEKVYQQIDKYS